MAGGPVCMDPSGHVVVWNAAMANMTATPAGEAIGRRTRTRIGAPSHTDLRGDPYRTMRARLHGHPRSLPSPPGRERVRSCRCV